MGNVRHLASSAGAIVGTYDYDPFGRLIGKSGAAADACPFRFSTKYLDEETGLYYYGHRYYDPCSLKWLSRDPLGEQGGLNLTAFCANDPLNHVDALGLMEVATFERLGGSGYAAAHIGSGWEVGDPKRASEARQRLWEGRHELAEGVGIYVVLPYLAVAAAPVGLSAAGGAVETGSIWLYLNTVSPAAIKIAAGSGLGYALLRFATGIPASNPQIYGARFQAYSAMSRVGSSIGSHQLTQFFRSRQVAQGIADRQGYLDFLAGRARVAGVPLGDVIYVHRPWDRVARMSPEALVPGGPQNNVIVSRTAFNWQISPQAIFGHELGHVGQATGLSYAEAEARASLAGSELLFLSKEASAELIRDYIYRLSRDGAALPRTRQ